MYHFKVGDLVICKPSEEKRSPSNIDFEVYSKVIYLSAEDDIIILRRFIKQGKLPISDLVWSLSVLEREKLYQPMNDCERIEFLSNARNI